MSALWTSEDAAAATGGTVASNWEVSGLSIDSRTVGAGDLFIALSAARDGHDFVADALSKGAVAALVSRVPDGVSPERLLVVPDVMDALRALGAAGRARTKAKVIAVTGSVGKTTTKEMLRSAFSGQGKVHAAEASFNNHWGVPITLARMPVDTDFAIIEIGMNAPGEIAPLAKLARPHIAIVTTVAAAHLEAFGAIEGIAQEKADIYHGLEKGGLALAHADIEEIDILAGKAEACGATLIQFGTSARADARLLDLRISDHGTAMKLSLRGEERLLTLAAPGQHFGMNALIALATVQAAGADVTEASLHLAQWTPFEGRGTRETVQLSPADDLRIDLIDDAFNANPTSMAAALEVLAAAEPSKGGRRIAVLGDMLELGETGPALHSGLADLPAMVKLDQVHTVGPLMAHLHAALPGAIRGLHVGSAEDMVHALPQRLMRGDVLLIKGSKGIKVSRVVDALRKLGQAAVGNM